MRSTSRRAGSAAITYANYPAPNGLGADSGEPSIGADLKTGKTMFQAGLQALRVTWDDSVSPGNATWQDVSFPTASAASLDPIGFMDQRTSRWFSSQLSGTTSLAASTDDDGANWLPSEGGPLNGGVDHQTFGGGPYAAPLTGGVVFPDAVYYCSQDLVAALCARSDTGGTTFNPAGADLHRPVRRPARPRAGVRRRNGLRAEQELRRRAGRRRSPPTTD